MSTYRLQDWAVGHYAATGRWPAHAEVVLLGMGGRGILRRRAALHEERARIELLPTDTTDGKGSQALVRRAMAQSAGRWKGKP